jgi:hypothetical protein
MRKLAEEYSADIIGQQLIDQLPWGHIITLIYSVSNKQERSFYIKETIKNSWSRNILSTQIEANLFERQGKSLNIDFIF